MKKILFLLAFTFTTLIGFTQQKGKDYVTMKSEGKMYWMRGGKNIKMAIDVPLSNGSTVSAKGVIKGKDGETTQMQPGDKVMMDGTIVPKKSKS